ncbi:gas vesicle protein GvpG [Actinopolymorpha sp. NPDC004070]|uniref:gas vesicle protein GvpG n=1 Tax=Actinopolymorpha sp. NPDC004070 TaxID=3154548 RepID=UPI0033BE3AED
MGLVTGLFTLPLAPVRGVGWIAEQVRDLGEKEYYDVARIRGELADLADAYDAGELSEEEFDAAEDEILDRLEEAQRRATG